jgi:4-O-beta-D-mannosyl-D-glucose phosphorylase
MFRNELFEQREARLRNEYTECVARRNEVEPNWDNGVFLRYCNPVVTAAHIPLEWRYDFNKERNPFLMERMGMNAAFNAGAIEHNGKVMLAVRLEGDDRKSFFGICESETGIDQFRFHGKPCVIPETDRPDTNVYDMRLVKHEDGWIYGLFCTERKDNTQPGNLSAAEAQCGIVRTRDFTTWERLPDLKSPSPQQRNVVLHQEFVDGKYLLYTRPQDGFIDAGSGGGIGYGFSASMENAVILEENIMDRRIYHTIKEHKNGLGPAPIKTEKGWLHLAHGVRPTASGLRYVLYMFMTALEEPWRVIHSPAGHFMAPWGKERLGDLVSILFTNGWVKRKDDSVLIYYASCDTSLHVAYSTVDRLIDYCMNTPEDPLRSAACVQQRIAMIEGNRHLARV